MKQVVISSVSKSYGKVKVLENVNLSFTSNSINGVIGKNGAGKSTLLQCIAGFIDYSGVITLEGIQRIGLLPASPYMFPRITGKEFIDFSLSAKKRDLNKDKLNKLNSIFEIPLNRFADEYSTGMLKKLHLIALLLQKNDLLLLDEPFDGLDAVSVAYLTEILKKERAEDRVILITSHDTNRLSKIVDTVTYVDGGRAEMLTGSIADFEKEIEDTARGRIDLIYNIK